MSEQKRIITQDEIAKFMEGKDPQERIVNLEYSYQDPFIQVFYRDEQDRKCVEKQPFYPIVWATYDACDKLCGGDRAATKALMIKHCIGVKALSNRNIDGEQCHDFDNGYRFMFYAEKPMSYSNFLKFFRLAGNPVYKKEDSEKKAGNRDGNRQYMTVRPEAQFLITTGKRFFKGYTDYDQLLRMTFDLETEGLDPTRHRIKLNGVKLNRDVTINGRTYHNWGHIFKLEGETEEEKNASELKMIDMFLRLIYTFKPDIITAHNGENFDWNFIIKRCEMLGTSIEDMSKPYFGEKVFIHKETKESILKLGGEVETFYKTIVPNTTVTDSLHAVRRAQATNSSIKKADLKYISKFLGIKKDNRVYTPGQDIDKILSDKINKYAFNDTDGDWYLYDEASPNGRDIEFKKGKNGDKPFIMYKRNYLADGYKIVTGEYIIDRYLLDDVWECDRVEYSYNGTDFMLAKIIPETFSKCTTMGTAGQWKAIMLAWSYENGLAIPLAANTGAFTGGLSRLLRVGYVKNIVKLDYNSLYPSIILTWGISDSTDLMQAMLHMLEYVLTSRERYKGLKKAAEKIVDKYEEELNQGIKLLKEMLAEYETAKNDFKVNDNNQAVVKKLGNSFFGSYGSNNGAVFPWKSKKCAEQTTCTGRQCLRLMISHFHNLGYEPIVGDTDGFNFQLPDSQAFRYTKEHPYVGKGLNREVKAGKEYTGFEADVAEFNDMYMKDFHYSPNAVNKMGLGIDEVVSSTINFSRKNYADYFPTKPYPDDVKLVGNTIKSKKMPQYIEVFLDTAIRQLLRGEGIEFIEFYYEYLSKIYNYQIPLRDIATKGKIKKSIKEYLADVKQVTKAGRPKSRQAWYELAIKENLHVDNGDTIYYVNTGKSKSHSDVKKVTHYYYYVDGEKTEFSKKIDSGYKKYKKECELHGDTVLEKQAWIGSEYPGFFTEEEIVMNCILVPRDIVESESDTYCNDENGIEYNVAKYVDMFNSRIKPLLVCFDKSIRNDILVSNPEDRNYFTKEQCALSAGDPNKVSDQDTYEQLMTMEDKEIRFWMTYDMTPPFIEECKMGSWEDIKQDYLNRKHKEKQLGIDKIKEKFFEILTNMSISDIESMLDDGNIPASLMKLANVNVETGNFMCKDYSDVVIATINDIVDVLEEKQAEFENNMDAYEMEVAAA